MPFAFESQVRTGLPAGGRWIRTPALLIDRQRSSYSAVLSLVSWDKTWDKNPHLKGGFQWRDQR